MEPKTWLTNCRRKLRRGVGRFHWEDHWWVGVLLPYPIRVWCFLFVFFGVLEIFRDFFCLGGLVLKSPVEEITVFFLATKKWGYLEVEPADSAFDSTQNRMGDAPTSMAYFMVRSEVIFGCHNLRGKKFLNPSCLDFLKLMIFPLLKNLESVNGDAGRDAPETKKPSILFALRMMLPLESIGFYWFGFLNFMVCFSRKKHHLDAKKVTFFPPGFDPIHLTPSLPASQDHSQKPMEAVQQAADQVKVWDCSWFLLKAVRDHRWNVDISEWGKMNIRYIYIYIYMRYIIFHLLFYIYIHTVHMIFQHEVIGSSSWLMLVFRIGEPSQNSLDRHKKLIMSAADSHKHKHVKNNKRTLWVTCFFLVAFLNCLPFPKAEVFEHPEHLLVNAPAPVFSVAQSVLNLGLPPKPALSSEVSGKVEALFVDTNYHMGYGIRMDTCFFLKSQNLQRFAPYFFWGGFQLQDDVRVHVCGCLQLQLVVTEKAIFRRKEFIHQIPPIQQHSCLLQK